MTSMNCRNVRQEIEDADPGDLLSLGVNEHMLGCVACETLSREQIGLQKLVSSLGTVEAPGDFDFRLQARLANERRGRSQTFTLGDLSFGFRSAVVAAVLLVMGAVLVFVSLRMNSGGSPSSLAINGAPKGIESVVRAGSDGETLSSPANDGTVVNANLNSLPTKHRGTVRPEVASLQDSNRQRTRDLSSTPAVVINRDQLAEAYQNAAFPLEAGYQSLKVSVDDGRGASRTISLPTVSFGSQRSLAQNPAPLMASTRGAW